MKCILGRKIAMSQIYASDGSVVPVTAIAAGPCSVTQVKTKDRDGYAAIQLGFGEKKHVSKSLQGHLSGLLKFRKEDSGFRYMREMRMDSVEGIERGAIVDLASFAVGDKVQVSGISKGKGFAGVVKRHHFHGHPTTHGHKDQERMPGSIGSGGVQHVLKGKRMAGRMGSDQVTVKGLSIVEIDTEKQLLYLSGAVPGARNGLIIIEADGDATYVLSALQEPQKEEVSPAPVVSQDEPHDDASDISEEPKLTPSHIPEAQEVLPTAEPEDLEGVGLGTDEISERAEKNPLTPQAEAAADETYPASQDEVPTDVAEDTGEVKKSE